MIEKKTTEFHFSTGIESFPELKVMFIDENYYAIVVQPKVSKGVYFDDPVFVILRKITLNGFGYMAHKDGLVASIDYFDNRVLPYKKKVKSLSLKQFQNHILKISKELNLDLWLGVRRNLKEGMTVKGMPKELI